MSSPVLAHRDDLATVWNGDALEVLRALPAASVHAVTPQPRSRRMELPLDRMLEMRRDGQSVRQIGLELGVSASLVARRLREVGAPSAAEVHAKRVRNARQGVHRSPVPDSVTDLVSGIAAEHLVVADLLLSGRKAFLTEQHCAYDVVADVDGTLVRIQVKSTRGARKVPQRANHVEAYFWNVRRAGKRGARTYADDEFDLLALVALDIRRIAYVPLHGLRQSVVFSSPGSPGTGKNFDDYTFTSAMGGAA